MIYLDYNATTPLDPAVVEAMLPYLREHYGNPSSTHALGKRAHEAVETARRQIAALIGADAEEIVFTGGGTEASNHAIKGSVFARFVSKNLFRALVKGVFGRWGNAQGRRLSISAIEHPATLQPCAFLKRLGCRVTIVPVDGQGMVDPDAPIRQARSNRGRQRSSSIMHSNNEVGTLQPIKEIAKICKERLRPVAHRCGTVTRQS